jgi:ABC-type glycerol-3-phosphate transport system permease component
VAGVFAIPCFYRIQIESTIASVSLVVMALALGGYYLGWLRYVLRGRHFALLFSPMWGIPLPMAVLPVIYFGAASGLLRSWPLAVATVVFAIGHLAVSSLEQQRIAPMEH